MPLKTQKKINHRQINTEYKKNALISVANIYKLKGVFMKKLIATIILTISICNIVKAIEPVVTNELNKIYVLYNREDYLTAEQQLQNLIATSAIKLQSSYILELGDLYLDKLNNLTKAESIYRFLIEQYPKYPNIADIYYRLGVTYEKAERFLEAAQMYELVATKYRFSKYAPDALDAIERCFKKNYQDVVAKIDNYPITRIEFDDRVAQNPSAYEKFEQKQQLLKDMINERLMYLEALARGIDQIPEYKNRFIEIRTNIMFQNYYQREVINKVKVTESEKKSYYSKRKEEFIIPEQVSAKEILIKTKPEADSLYRLITTYKLKFDSVAQETSLAPTKSMGGDLGYFQRGTQPKEIEDKAFKLKPGEISKPFYSETKSGYILLKVEDHKPKKVRTYKEAAAEIENRLRTQKIDETFKSKTDEYKKASSVIIDELAIKENKDTIALIDGDPILQKHINDYLQRIPPFYRSEFETPEGKKRILDQMVLEKTWLKGLEREKYWLLNSVISQLQDAQKSLLRDNLRRIEVTDKVVVSDNEIQQEYTKNLNEYKVPKQVRAREITVPTESLATEIRKLALTGKIAFDSLAREYSTAPSKRMGGDMGFFSTGSKPKEIEDVVFKLKVGQISKVIKQGDSAFTIIKVEEIKEAYTKKLDEVKATLQRKLQQQKDQEFYKNFTTELSKSHQIETFLVDETIKEQAPETETQKSEAPTPETPQPK